jgi:4-hydroxybenzoate polyprenyltransferase
VAIVLFAAEIGGALVLGRDFAAVGVGYMALMMLYSSVLKHLVILDVLTIAGGFVLRALGGAVVIHVQFSHWLLMLTLLLALFLALGKRRGELVGTSGVPGTTRRVLTEYSPGLLDQLIGVVTPSTLLAYAFYTISPETVARFGTDRLLLTLPFPLYGIFRYLYLIHQRDGGHNPSETLLSDPPLLACIVLWAASVIAVLYGP